ncbi:hypothetical protein PLICRDRAFT_34892 [Plicaturopsis crispa FD-325 SS-3]|nr:hypothetical protein PLICRDRAFT_34892 [Plicaturopsis crispa FD-325 SS-3]
MSDFSAFQSSFKGDLVTPADADYPQAISRWAINSERNAKVVAFVKDAADASLAIRYARSAGLPIAIRGGGHSPSGASSSEGGLVVDLSRYLNKTRVDPALKLAYVGGGAVWEAVDTEAIKHGLATVGGTVNHTGVGGLLLGGGYGWLSGAHGLALDNLEQATIVTADGSILTANDKENSDLFWAIRGGGCNFGAVTEFVMRLHPQRATVYAGPLVFTADKEEAIVELSAKRLQRGLDPNAGTIQVFTKTPDGNAIVAAFVFYNGSEAEGRAHWKELFDIGPVADHSGELPYEKLNGMQNPGVPHGYASYMKGVFQLAPDPASIRVARARALAILASHPEFKEVNLLFEYFSLAKINSFPENGTAFRRGPAGNVLILLKWEGRSAETQTKAREFAQELAGIIVQGQTELLGKGASVGYGNYDGESGVVPQDKDGKLSQSRAETLFGEHYPRLQAIKKRYDPDLVFSKWFGITPA